MTDVLEQFNSSLNLGPEAEPDWLRDPEGEVERLAAHFEGVLATTFDEAKRLAASKRTNLQIRALEVNALECKVAKLNRLKGEKEEGATQLRNRLLELEGHQEAVEEEEERYRGKHDHSRHLEEELKEFIKEVAKLEAKSAERRRKLLAERDAMLETIWFYKRFLGARVDLQPPDTFALSFARTKAERDDAGWLHLKTNDFKQWSLVGMSGDPSRLKELKSQLEESGDIVQIVTQARAMLKPKTNGVL